MLRWLAFLVCFACSVFGHKKASKRLEPPGVKTLVPTTLIPPTLMPPTQVPPTSVSPTQVPPTTTPLTLVPSTPVPTTSTPTTLTPPTLVTQVPSTSMPSTQVPPTTTPLTLVPPMFAPTTSTPTTLTPPTLMPPTQVPSTQVPPTSVPPTQVPLTQVPSTPVPTTSTPTTLMPPTQVPPTSAPPTSMPSTRVPPTTAPLTQVPSTFVPTTSTPTTLMPPTQVPPTSVPPTQVPPTTTPLTLVPLAFVPITTPIPPTIVPLTQVPVTRLPPTQVPPTSAPLTATPPTQVSPTDAPLTLVPPTFVPITLIPTTLMPPTVMPPTQLPPTTAPLTLIPPTFVPLTQAPPTGAPLTQVPTPIPSTQVPGTLVPSAQVPLTNAPTSLAPRTPGTPSPLTQVPPLTLVPLTQVPPALSPTQRPSTQAPPTQAPLTLVPPLLSPFPAPPEPRHEAPSHIHHFTPAAESARNTVSATATVSGSVAAGVALLGGISGGAATGQAVVLGALRCRLDEGDIEFVVHPLRFSVGGEPEAGAVVGNTLLSVGVGVAMTGIVRALSMTGYIGRDRAPGAVGVTARQRTEAVLRYPSILMALPLVLFPGTLESAMKLLIRPRGSFPTLIGLFGVAVCLGSTAFLCYAVARPPAHLAPRRKGNSKAKSFLLGSRKWVPNDEAPLHVARVGLAYDLYCDIKFLRGRYFLAELVPLFFLATISAFQTGHPPACAAQALLMLLVVVATIIFTVWARVFLAPFVMGVMVAAHASMAVGLLLHFLAYAQGETEHWGIEYGTDMFIISLTLAVLRALYDVYTIFGCCKPPQEKAVCLEAEMHLRESEEPEAEAGVSSGHSSLPRETAEMDAPISMVRVSSGSSPDHDSSDSVGDEFESFLIPMKPNRTSAGSTKGYTSRSLELPLTRATSSTRSQASLIDECPLPPARAMRRDASRTSVASNGSRSFVVKTPPPNRRKLSGLKMQV